MIVHCGGMIRSGSTLQYNITYRIVETLSLGRHLHCNENAKQILANDWDRTWLVNKGHVYKPYHVPAKCLAEGKFRLVMIYRDLRDVLVSTMRFRRRTFDETLAVLVEETIERERGWFRYIPKQYIYRSRYEDVIKDVEREIINISNFLDLRLTYTEIKAIYNETNLNATKQHVKQLNNMQAHTRYGPRHIGGVKHGQYKDVLTKQQIKQIESIPEVNHWLIENGYRLEF